MPNRPNIQSFRQQKLTTIYKFLLHHLKFSTLLPVMARLYTSCQFSNALHLHGGNLPLKSHVLSGRQKNSVIWKIKPELCDRCALGEGCSTSHWFPLWRATQTICDACAYTGLRSRKFLPNISNMIIT